MRIDKFLSTVNIVKRRSISEDMCKSRVVFLNDRIVKPAKEVKVGDIITLKYLEKEIKYRVLKIPTTNSIPKSKKDEYVEEIKWKI